jgi:hypothetical protein
MPSPLPDDVRRALSAGQKIEAIRLLREAKGLGLKEAMDLVREASHKGGRQPNRDAPRLSPGEVPRTKLSPGIIAFVVVLIAAIAWLLVGKW